MNIDLKIFNKIVVNLIQQCVQKCIHYDQVRFITDMQGWFNTQISINIIYHKLKKKNYIIIIIDTEKALTKSNTHS